VNTPKPTFYIHVWEGQDITSNFAEIDYADFLNLKHHTDGRTYTFVGNFAIVTVFTDILTLTRSKALQMATSFMRGWYVRYDVDLNKCIVVITEGQDKTHPPY